jgi:medium-chain acyl-[acyl-carrier-protein] hydrolase
MCLRRRPGAAVRLFCFPYAGAGASVFQAWAGELPNSIEAWTIHLPGRERRIAEAPLASIDGLVAALFEGAGELFRGRFAFFGHSMGVMVSFELTRLLRRRGLDMPCCLLVSALGAPHLRPHPELMADLPEPEFIAHLHKLNGTPAEVLDNPELLSLVLPMLRADFHAVETYAYAAEPPLACPIRAYGGTNDPDVPREDLEAWSLHTGNFASRLFEGDHFYINSRRRELIPHVARDILTLCG